MYATSRVWNEWQSFYARSDIVNSICGFGKETPSARSRSFVSLANNRNDLNRLIYSFEITPVLSSFSSANSHKLLKQADGEHAPLLQSAGEDSEANKNPYVFSLEDISTLTIGGYDTNDYVGNMTWYDTSDCVGGWNITGSALTIGNDMNLNPNGTDTDFTIEMQVGYPYIGIPTYTWNETVKMMNETLNLDRESYFRCNSGNWGAGRQYCYWYGTECSQINTNDLSLNITMGNLTYSIPLRNLLADTMEGTRHDCDMYISQVYYKYDNMIRLGDPFFSAFLPVFDVDNDMIGLAQSARALPLTAVNPGAPTPTPTPVPTQFDIDAIVEEMFQFEQF